MKGRLILMVGPDVFNHEAKAALKPPHSPAGRDWRDSTTPSNLAKRLECGGFSAAIRSPAKAGPVDFILIVTRLDCQKSENSRHGKRNRRRLDGFIGSVESEARQVGAQRRVYSEPGTSQKSVYFLLQSGYFERSFD